MTFSEMVTSLNYRKRPRLSLFKPVALLCLLTFAAVAVAKPGTTGTVPKNVSQSNVSKTAPITTTNKLYGVAVKRGHIRTTSGISRAYTLYLPQNPGKLPGPPYPVFVVIHGFLMTGKQQENNAHYLAERGFVVFTPNITKVLLGDKNRMQNVKDILDEMNWLTEQSKSAKSPLHGLIDANRLAVGGNSSGGAVDWELVIEGQKANIPIYAMCSLDGVPWDRTLSRVSQIKPLHILSLRAEPSLCNYQAKVLQFLRLLKFPTDDVKINGAAHCDAENPTSLGCMCVCGKSSAKYRQFFQLLAYLYLRDTLKAPKLDVTNKSFIEVVEDFQKENKVIAHLNAVPGCELSSQPSKQISGMIK